MTSFSELARALELKTEFDEVMEKYEGKRISIPGPRYLTKMTAELFDKWAFGGIEIDDTRKLGEISREFLKLTENMTPFITDENEELYDEH